MESNLEVVKMCQEQISEHNTVQKVSKKLMTKGNSKDITAAFSNHRKSTKIH